MQVYRRIANPYMPQGTPNLTNAPSPFYAPGEVGCAFSDQNTGNEYLRVVMDSGASAGGAGAPLAGMLAFWKNQAQGLVTTDKVQCDVGATGAINRVAGILQVAVTCAPGQNGTDGNPLQYMTDLVIRGQCNVQTAAALAGAQATVDTTASTARATYTTGVNTAPVSQVLGTFVNGTISSNLSLLNVSIAFSE